MNAHKSMVSILVIIITIIIILNYLSSILGSLKPTSYKLGLKRGNS